MNSAASVSHMDRQVTNTSAGVSASYSGGTTTWTLPYAVATDQETDGYLALARTDTNTWLNPVSQLTLLPAPIAGVTVTRPTTTSIAVTGLGNMTSTPMVFGILYLSSYTLSTLYLRNQKGAVEQRGRLRIGYLNISHNPMTDMTVVVTPQGRLPYTYIFSDPLAQTEIQPYRVPVQCRNEDSTIEIFTYTPGSIRLDMFDWEGEYVVRSRQQ